jgi:SAM-dependent methyltransferase
MRMTPRIAPVNETMAALWNGDDGRDWTEHEERYNASAAAYDEALFEAAAVGEGDAVLDVGCGTGATTRQAARRATAGSALGVDISAPMIERARRRAAEQGLPHARFEHADAQVHDFEPQAFDVLISRFGASFFGGLAEAWANLATAVRPGGRVAVVSWQALAENEWMLSLRAALAAGRDLPVPPAGAPGPFGLADPDATRRLLGDAGFDDIELHDVRRRLRMGDDVDDAFAYVRTLGMVRGLSQDLDEATVADGLARIREMLTHHATDKGVLVPSAAYLVTATRRTS